MYTDVFDRWLDAVPLRRKVSAYLAEQGTPVYVVGGTVRDVLLGRQGCDMDLAVAGAAMTLAREVADRIRAAYVPLDPDRGVARVVVRTATGLLHVDLADLRAESLEADLWARDFTVNAMAMPLGDGWGTLIDPTGGQADLRARLLRAVREDVFVQDPLRILRGVRLRGSLGFALTPETEDLARAHVPGLSRVSVERIRDELFLILDQEDAAASLAYAQRLDALGRVLPELSTATTAQAGMRVLARLDGMLRWVAAPGGESPPGMLAEIIGPHRAALRDHWQPALSSERARWLLLKLAALCSGSADAVATVQQVAERLHLSTRETRYLPAVLASSARVSAWSAGEQGQALAVYRYYRQAGDAGVDGAVLAAVRRMAEEEQIGASPWSGCVRLVRLLLRAWFCEQATLVDPPPLISGHDVIGALGTDPGPVVGELLERVREAQVQGIVTTRQDALRYLQGSIP